MQRTFGRFRFDLATGELRSDGVRVPLQPIIEKLLTELAASPGSIVRRDDLAARLWPEGTHVDYENSLNNAIARLRAVIGPRWIETVPKRGYRFRAPKTRIAYRPHPDAEKSRLRGEHFWNRTTADSLARSAAYFENATQSDPDHAAAWSGLAHAHIMMADQIVDGTDARESLGHARRAAERALTAAPDSSQAMSALGLVAWRANWDWDSAERYLRAAIAVDPNYARGHLYYGWMLQARRRTRESLAHVTRAQALDPLSPFVGTNVAWMLYTSRRFTDAIAVLNDVLDLEPHYAMAHLARGLSLQHSGRRVEAVTALARAASLSGGRNEYYRAALAQAQAENPELPADGAALDRALLFIARRDFATALDLLEQAVNESSSHLSYLLVDPLFDPLRSERRFQRLTRRLGLA